MASSRLAKTLALIEKIAESPGTHVLELSGRTVNRRRAFASCAEDQVLPPVIPRSHVVSGWSLFPLSGADGAVQSIGQVSYLLIGPQEGEGRWSVHAVCSEPWTVPRTRALLDSVIADPDALREHLGYCAPGAVHKVGPGRDVVYVASQVLETRRSIIVLAHAPDRELLRYYMKLLSSRAPFFKVLLDFTVYDDPAGKWRRYFLERPVPSPTGGEDIRVVMPPPGGIAAVLPPLFPRSLLPQDLPLELTKPQAKDAAVVDAWLERLAELMVHPQWAYDTELRGVVFAAYRQQLVGNLATDVPVALYGRVQELEQKVKDLRARLDALLRDYKELDAVAQQRLVAQDAAQAALEQARAVDRELRAELQARDNELERLRGLDAARLVAQRQEALDARAVALERAGELGEEVAALRARVAALEEQVGQDVPHDWRELYAYAGTLEHVDVPDTALIPAWGTLDQGHESRKWLERTWAVLCHLERYAREKAEGATGLEYGNFRMYVQAHPQPYVTDSRVTLGESASVRDDPSFARERTFDTPIGQLYMPSHVRIGSSKPPAPRLHFYDDTSGVSGRVYVGWIGPHRRNKSTN